MDRVRRELDIVDPVPILYCTDFRILALATMKVHMSIDRKQSSKEEKRPHPFLEVCVIQLRKILEGHWELAWNCVIKNLKIEKSYLLTISLHRGLI